VSPSPCPRVGTGLVSETLYFLVFRILAMDKAQRVILSVIDHSQSPWHSSYYSSEMFPRRQTALGGNDFLRISDNTECGWRIGSWAVNNTALLATKRFKTFFRRSQLGVAPLFILLFAIQNVSTFSVNGVLCEVKVKWQDVNIWTRTNFPLFHYLEGGEVAFHWVMVPSVQQSTTSHCPRPYSAVMFC
jgi:hypothetical protein